jgi:two-component system, NarL family, invasion response regulator UvrY
MSTRVLIVDDVESFRRAARAVVQAIDGFEVVGEAASGEESLEKTRVARPHLVLMDVNLPGISGIQAARQIKEEFPRTVVLLLSTREAVEFVGPVIESGAAAYIPKSMFSPQRLIDVWKGTLAGQEGSNLQLSDPD